MSNEEAFLSRMIETLKLLACGYEDQKASLPDYVHLPDELVISFSEAYLLFEQVVDAGLVSQDQIEKVQAVEALFDTMQKNRAVDDPWTYEAVQSGENWRRVRALAQDALGAFGVTELHHNLSWATYVPGANKTQPVMNRVWAWFHRMIKAILG